MIVAIVLGFYVLVCVSVVLFNCWKVVSEKLYRRSFERRKENCLLWLRDIAERHTPLLPDEQRTLAEELARSLRSNHAVLAFHAAMEDAEKSDPKTFEGALPLVAEVIQRLYPFYADRSAQKQAYYSFLVTRFQMMNYAPSERVTAYLLEQIRAAKSLYNLENALRAVYSSGQLSLVLRALRTLDGKDGILLHEKLLVDGLLTFEDREALIAALWEQFPLCSTQMCRLLLDYIRFASGAWGEQMLALLERTDELEIRIACLRYLGKYPDERFRVPIYRLTEESRSAEWELCAVCMTALAAYPGDETLRLLKQGLCSQNWYVRYNAALSLRVLAVGTEQLQDILTGDDRYAREMLQYRLGLTAAAETEKEAVPV